MGRLESTASDAAAEMRGLRKGLAMNTGSAGLWHDQLMEHRHLNHGGFTLAAIDDIISRGKQADWFDLRQALLEDPAIIDKIEKICRRQIQDPYAQRYHFWSNYAKRQREIARMGEGSEPSCSPAETPS